MDLEQEVEKLEAEKSRLLSLERVESIARTHLNLILPEKDQMIFAETTDNDSDHE
jgi:cell division protein FtsL